MYTFGDFFLVTLLIRLILMKEKLEIGIRADQRLLRKEKIGRETHKKRHQKTKE